MIGDAEVGARPDARRVLGSAYRMPEADPQRELTAGWLYRAATNGAISFVRRRKIVRMLPLDRGGSTASSGASTSAGAASIDLQAALRQLPAEQSPRRCC